MTEKRFQVFVSSTFQDLVEERREVIQALLELDCIPAGMELFPAANEDQWALIRRVISDCDYYLVITANRYGSIGQKGLSYTEMEYRFALSIGKPIIGFVHRNPGSMPMDRSEQSEVGRKKLESFIRLVRKKPIKTWSSPQELGSVVSRGLIQLMKTTPAIGWVRANVVAAVPAMPRVSQPIESLGGRLNELQISMEDSVRPTAELAQGDDELRVGMLMELTSISGTIHAETFMRTTWNKIFDIVAVRAFNGCKEMQILNDINDYAHVRFEINERMQHALDNCEAYSGHVDIHDFKKIRNQFLALGLMYIEPDEQGHERDAIWKLSTAGVELMRQNGLFRRKSV